MKFGLSQSNRLLSRSIWRNRRSKVCQEVAYKVICSPVIATAVNLHQNLSDERQW
ncbi:MAG: hypothetical protein LM632_08220 [Armatimonadetes bacterium]|nr:hypothetical protein [Armatimonadota bacterium]